MLRRGLLLPPAELLGTVTEDEFQALGHFVQQHPLSLVPGELNGEIGINSSECWQTVKDEVGALSLRYLDYDEAVSVINPFIRASRGWLLHNEEEGMQLSYTRAVVKPGDALRISQWHVDGGRTGDVLRTTLFRNIGSTLIAQGRVRDKELGADFKNALQHTRESIHTLTEQAIASGILSAVPAALPFHGAGITERTIHKSPVNETNAPRVETFVRLMTTEKKKPTSLSTIIRNSGYHAEIEA